jgi:hypothetical protein
LLPDVLAAEQKDFHEEALMAVLLHLLHHEKETKISPSEFLESASIVD